MNSKVSKYLIRIVLILLGLSVIGVTLFLFLYVFWKGKTVMSLSFILDKPAGVPIGTSGGIFPALMGSLYLGALAALIGGILGIGASAYLVFYHRNKYVSGIVNFAITGLSGIPSILFGLVGYTLLIYGFGISRSLLCASLCVSAMIVPFVAIRARKVFEEKGMGAVAPILYTGAVMQAGVPSKLTDPFMSLPYHLYTLVNNGFSLDYAYGTAFVLMLLLLIIQLICKFVTYMRKGN